MGFKEVTRVTRVECEYCGRTPEEHGEESVWIVTGIDEINLLLRANILGRDGRSICFVEKSEAGRGYTYSMYYPLT